MGGRETSRVFEFIVFTSTFFICTTYIFMFCAIYHRNVKEGDIKNVGMENCKHKARINKRN